jgi:hypothetical protein
MSYYYGDKEAVDRAGTTLKACLKFPLSNFELKKKQSSETCAN